MAHLPPIMALFCYSIGQGTIGSWRRLPTSETLNFSKKSGHESNLCWNACSSRGSFHVQVGIKRKTNIMQKTLQGREERNNREYLWRRSSRENGFYCEGNEGFGKPYILISVECSCRSRSSFAATPQQFTVSGET